VVTLVLAPTYARYHSFAVKRMLDMSKHYYIHDKDDLRGYPYEELEIFLVDTTEVDEERLDAVREAIKRGAKGVYFDSRHQPSGKRVIFTIKGTGRILAILRPDGNNWFTKDAVLEETNALLPWIGKIRKYVEARSSLAEITIQLEVDYDHTRARFRHVAEAAQEEAGHGGPVQGGAQAEREGVQDC